jgi:transposase
MTDHTPISQVSRLEVISTGARRRWTLAEKQRIVAESYSPPRVVSATARRNGLPASQLFTWRRLAGAGRLTEAEEAAAFAPAIISREASSTSSPSFPERVEGMENLPHAPLGIAGRIEIVSTWGRHVGSTMASIQLR